jgi:CRISPR/Cas system Type II protein with McrA/HNH and RuvC-like nuclease domain
MPHHSARCTECFYKQVAHGVFNNIAEWEALRDLFAACGARCAYSGRTLTLGLNAELDHIIPAARGGPNILDNVHWVDHDINQMKRDLGENEFLGLVRDIATHRLGMIPSNS